VWRRTLIACFVCLILIVPTSAGAQPSTDPLSKALGWLEKQQQPDGGFSNGFAPGTDPSTTADAVLATLAGHVAPSDWKSGGKTPLDALTAAVQAKSLKGPGVAAKVALAVQAAGLNPRDFAGTDLIAEVQSGFATQTGLFGGGPFDSALSMLALTAAKQPLPANAVAGLLAVRLADGSYSFNGDTTAGAGDSNTTAIVIQALIAAGAKADTQPSLGYLRGAQNPDGGWTYQKPSQYGEATDANSTALAMQALLAAGEDLQAWKNPRQALLSLQLPSGAFIFNATTPGENLLATVQAIPALAATEPTKATSPVQADWVILGLVLLVLVLGGAAFLAARRR
jgi:hypothetical protein